MKRRDGRAKHNTWQIHLRWLQPGLGVKRWFGLLLFGIGLLGLGGAVFLREFYPLPWYFYYLTLQFLPRVVRTALILTLSLGSIGVALWQLNRAMLAPFMQDAQLPVAELLYNYRRRGRGPRIVTLGGGHGLTTLLRGLKHHTSNLTAIVTVADDGGSSGRLRRDLGILPPGDLRNCVAALADDESLVTRLFQYRFSSGAGLEGHNFGNLFIGAMSGVTGSFESALEESSRVLAIQGRVLPSTLQAVTLAADVQLADGRLVRVRGESRIPEAQGRIINVTLEPEQPAAYPAAVRALLNADVITIGPGSLYTSLLPTLLIPDIAQALRASRASKVYLCNITNQPGETDGYGAEQHVEALEKHLGPGLFSIVVVNEPPADAPPPGLHWIAPELQPRPDVRILRADLRDMTHPSAHDSEKLARVMMELLK